LFDSNEQDSNFYNILELSFSKGDKEYTKLLEIKRDFGININFSTSSDTVFNLYLFQFYLRLHELEETLQ